MSTAALPSAASGNSMGPIRVTAPAKAILFGEHAVNRGQPALAVSVGLFASCTLSASGTTIKLQAERHHQHTTRDEILAFGRAVDGWRACDEYAAIQRCVAEDFFAPAKYVLAAPGEALPEGLQITLSSTIPPSSGLGSGGAVFAALATGLAALLGCVGDKRLIAGWARRGDIVAHGGVASGLDTQTSLYGGAIRYTAKDEGQPIAYQRDLALVIGDTGVIAATSVVNGRVRAWLAEDAVRMHYFEEIGLLSRYGQRALAAGDWPELGRLMNLNQLLLERIGVSCPELEACNQAALAAGALGAKLAGSGGGGIMIALTTPDRIERVATAIAGTGAMPFVVPVCVPGAGVEK